MSKYFIGTEEECKAVVAAIDKQCGYLKRGTHVGGGIHVDMPETYSPGAPGWTATHDLPKEDSTAKGRGFVINVDGFEKVEDFDASKLDAKEIADLDAVSAKLAAATELPADWQADLKLIAVEEPPKEEPVVEEIVP